MAPAHARVPPGWSQTGGPAVRIHSLSDEDLHNQGESLASPLVIRFRDSESIKTQRVLLLPNQTQVLLKASGTVRWADANGSGKAGSARIYRTRMTGSAGDLPKLELAEQTNFQINQWRLARRGSEPVGKSSTTPVYYQPGSEMVEFAALRNGDAAKLALSRGPASLPAFSGRPGPLGREQIGSPV